jgi:hypothetical protein
MNNPGYKFSVSLREFIFIMKSGRIASGAGGREPKELCDEYDYITAAIVPQALSILLYVLSCLRVYSLINAKGREAIKGQAMAHPLKIACQECTSCIMFWLDEPEHTGGFMTSDELVYRHRLDIFKDFLEHNVSVVELCREHKRSRTWFYRWLLRYTAYGEEGLRTIERNTPAMPNQTPPHGDALALS